MTRVSPRAGGFTLLEVMVALADTVMGTLKGFPNPPALWLRRAKPASANATGGQSGFTLLEVMVALAILGMALVVLVGITTTNVRNTQHAKFVTTATFLARAKMAELEDVVLEEGFVDNDQEEEGDFSENAQPDFRWKTLIEKVELPTDLAQQTQEMTQNATEANSDNPLAAMAGFMGGFMTTLIEPIRVGLEEAVRRVTVQVFWEELGRPTQSFEVVTFMTDPAKLDMAVQAIGNLPGTTGQQQGQGGSTGQGQGGSTGQGQGGSAPRPPATAGTGGRR
jgi:prepilin-type N-terminal cleavage/methylation domain-containing protein